MRITAILVFLYAFFNVSPLNASPPVYLHAPPSYIFHKIEQLTVLIEVPYLQNSEWEAACAGVIVGHNGTTGTDVEIMTAAHCVDPYSPDGYGRGKDLDLSRVSVTTRDKDVSTIAWVQTVKENDDIAEIEAVFPERHLINATIFKGRVAPRTILYLDGHPSSREWAFQRVLYEGAVDNSQYPSWSHDLMVQCFVCVEGNSGGGIWTTDARLIGILHAGDNLHNGYYLPIGRALKDLNRR